MLNVALPSPAHLLLVAAAFVTSLGAGAAPSCAADRALRSRVLQALKENDAGRRARALGDALRGARGAAAAKILVRTALPRAESERDRAVCVAALGRMDTHDEIEEIAARARDARYGVPGRAQLATALGRTGNATALDELRALAVDSDTRVRCAAVVALGRFPGPDSLAALSTALEDDDPALRLSATQALGQHEDELGLPLLVQALKSADGRFADDVAAVLGRRTGERFGPSWSAYERLLRTRAKQPTDDIVTSDPPPLDVSGPATGFRTGGVLFVLATSKSMGEPVSAGGEPRRLSDAGDDLVREWGEAATCLDVARVHLRALIRSVGDGVPFDVATYADSTTFAFGKLTPADARSRKKAESRVARLSPGGGANLADALRRCFDPRNKDPLGAHPGPDTVVLITNGQLGDPGETNGAEVLEGVRRFARSRPMRFICIAVGQSDRSVLGTLASTAPSGRIVSVP